MADEKKEAKMIFAVGVNLADGRRFEAGDKVPANLSPKELKVLRDINAIEDK